MKILGIDLRASEAIFAMVEVENGDVECLTIAPKKLKLTSDDTSDVKAFAQTFNAIVQDNGIERIVIKKRNKKGGFAGGAVSFKIEGIIQATTDIEVAFLSGPTISAVKRKHGMDIPESLNGYQATAFEVAFSFAKQ